MISQVPRMYVAQMRKEEYEWVPEYFDLLGIMSSRGNRVHKILSSSFVKCFHTSTVI